MIDEIDTTLNFQRLQLQNGDIICFQKALTEKEYVLKKTLLPFNIE
jgi:hypothetical protein